MRNWIFIILPLCCVFIFLVIDYFISSAELSYLSTNSQSYNTETELGKTSFPSPVEQKAEPSKSGNTITQATNTKEALSASSQLLKKSERDGSSQLSSYAESAGSAVSNSASLQLPPHQPGFGASFISGAPPSVFFSLKFINEQVLEPNLRFKNIPVGGLSALAYNMEKNIFLALSDDKGEKGRPPRFYKLKLSQELGKSKYALKMTDQVFLQNKMDQQFVPIDPEGVAFFKPDQIFISSEGVQLPNLTAPPAVFKFSFTGKWLSSLPLPKMYWPDNHSQLGEWGVKENKAFEALSLDMEKNQLWLGTESSLHQDDQDGLNTENKQYIRISRFDAETTKMTGQFMYQMDYEIKKGNLNGENGLTDFLSLGDQKLLVVERAYLKDNSISGDRKTDANSVRLFLTDCSTASDVSKYNEFKGKRFVTCGKRLLADLSSLLGDAVDNIEGITIGPEVTKGNFLLVLVSDNNFSRFQKTQFLFFHYSPDAENK